MGFWGFWGWRCENIVTWPPKGTTLREYVSIDVLDVKIGSTVWALCPWKDFAYKEEIKKQLSGNFGYMGRSITEHQWSPTFIACLCECTRWLAKGIKILSLAPKVTSRACLHGKNVFAVNWVKGSSLNDDVTGRQPISRFWVMAE